MANVIVVAILVSVVGCAIGYIVKAKKNGEKHIGCPSAGACGSTTACSYLHSYE